MTIWRLPPSDADIEPVYIYDDPNIHPIVLNGIYVDQKGMGRVRSVASTPTDMDRIAQTPLLAEGSNHDYANLHAGGAIEQYQRKLSMNNVRRIRDWWIQPTALSANPTLIWLPVGVVSNQFDNANLYSCHGSITPANWCKTECPHCHFSATQYGDHFEDNFYFDYCRNCGSNWRPGRIIDGQHRIRAMADRMLPDERYNEDILVTLLLQQAPLGIQPDAAAKLFIEINAGGTELDREHKDFLASHFDILNFSDPQTKSAYKIARDLNLAGQTPHDEWSQDTAAIPRRGRLTMMPGTPQSDFLPAWRIQEFVTKIVGRDYPVRDPVTRNIDSDTIYEWPNVAANLEQTVRHDLANYLRAISNVWEGNTGPRSAPVWITNRQQRGNLQIGNVLRSLLNLMPTIIRRIEINGDPKTVDNFESQLRLLRNISWTGAWANNLRGDGGMNKFSKVMTKLLLEAPYRWNPPAVNQGFWPNITDWYNGVHDPFSIINFSSTSTLISFEIETTCIIETSIVEPLSILGESSDSLLWYQVTPAGGAPAAWEVIPFDVSEGVNTIEVNTNAVAGDAISIRVQLSTSLNETLVDDNDYLAGASIQTTVI